VLAVCLIANPRTPSAEEPVDILDIVLDTALLEAKKIETIGGIDIKGLISRDTAYLLQTIEPNVCEVIFPVEGYDYSIGVTFTRENEQSGWTLLPVNAANVYDPGRWDGTPLSELGFDSIDLNANPGVGMPLVYESENFIIFYGDFGLFGYDLEKRQITFAIV
jgi:hypothetical protein